MSATVRIRARVLSQQDRSPVRVRIPGSKSHTIRSLLLAALVPGETILHNVLHSEDTGRCIDLVTNWGGEVEDRSSSLRIQSPGLHGFVPKKKEVYVGNSGTTLFFAMGIASLTKHELILDGDASLRTRSAQPLVQALCSLGAHIRSGNKGKAPFFVRHPITPGDVHIDCRDTSQYLSSLLYTLACCDARTTIFPTLSGEYGYVDMTISWLRRYGAHISAVGYKSMTIRKGIDCDVRIEKKEHSIPGDYSSAAFFFGAALVTGRTICVEGLDRNDTQPDKKVLKILESMGCTYRWEAESCVIMPPKHPLSAHDIEWDLSEIPDALPILAVVASYVKPSVRFYNVAHARKKESDRIAVMARELSKRGVRVSEQEDGLTLHSGWGLEGGTVQSHGDHRVAMAFSIGALAAKGTISIENAAVAAITFPGFYAILNAFGDIQKMDEVIS